MATDGYSAIMDMDGWIMDGWITFIVFGFQLLQLLVCRISIKEKPQLNYKWNRKDKSCKQYKSERLRKEVKRAFRKVTVPIPIATPEEVKIKYLGEMSKKQRDRYHKKEKENNIRSMRKTYQYDERVRNRMNRQLYQCPKNNLTTALTPEVLKKNKAMRSTRRRQRKKISKFRKSELGKRVDFFILNTDGPSCKYKTLIARGNMRRMLRGGTAVDKSIILQNTKASNMRKTEKLRALKRQSYQHRHSLSNYITFPVQSEDIRDQSNLVQIGWLQLFHFRYLNARKEDHNVNELSDIMDSLTGSNQTGSNSL